ARAGRNVYVSRSFAGLTDQLQIWQPVKQSFVDLSPFANEDEGFRSLKPFCERVYLLYRVIKDGNAVSGEFRETGKTSNSILIIVGNDNLHSLVSFFL